MKELLKKLRICTWDEKDQGDDIEKCVRVAFEVNRAYKISIMRTLNLRLEGDMPCTWEYASQHRKDSILNGIKNIVENLAVHKKSISNEEIHDNWVWFKNKSGWTWGHIVDYQAKTHPNIASYYSLPYHEQTKAALFKAVVISTVL